MGLAWITKETKSTGDRLKVPARPRRHEDPDPDPDPDPDLDPDPDPDPNRDPKRRA